MTVGPVTPEWSAIVRESFAEADRQGLTGFARQECALRLMRRVKDRKETT